MRDPREENLRSRSPDGRVNNLSVRFHRRPAPPSAGRVAPRLENMVSPSSTFHVFLQVRMHVCARTHGRTIYTVKRETVAY